MTPSRPPSANQRLKGLDALRGLAALSVVWFHITHGGQLLVASSLFPLAWATWLGNVGHQGVNLFFIISGFVIPWSLRSQYAGADPVSSLNISDFSRFFFRRFLRLQPPFFVACLLALVLNSLSSVAPGFHGSPVPGLSESLLALTRDNLFISSLVGSSWILVVGWTLALELQFYVTAGLIEPLLSPSRNCRWPYATRVCFVLLSMVLAGFLLPQSSLIFRSLPTFSLGWLLAHRFLRPHPVQVLGLVICLLSTAFWAGLLQAIVTLFFAALLWLALRWPRLFPSPLLAVGSISYSLYLLHVPIGGRVVNLATRFNPTPVQWLFVAVLATLLSLFASWIFYRLVEAPIHRFSRRLRPSLLIGR